MLVDEAGENAACPAPSQETGRANQGEEDAVGQDKRRGTAAGQNIGSENGDTIHNNFDIEKLQAKGLPETASAFF